MRVLVTGGAGYIGSHTVRELVGAGHDLLVYDDLSSGHRQAIGDVPLEVGDILDVEHLRRVVNEFAPDAVVHFAGLIQAGESMHKPLEYYRTNVVGGLSLLTVMKEASVKRVVFSSSAAVYGTPDDVPIPETHRTLPINTYGTTKHVFELMLEDFRRAYGLGFVSLRYFNAAGADVSGDLGEAHPVETHLIPLVFRAVMGKGAPLKVFGNAYDTPDGTCVRDYVHVTDLALAHVLALRAIAEGEGKTYNVGTGTGYSVLEVIRAVEEVTGQRVPHEVGPARAGDPPALVAMAQKIRDELGWEPKLSSLKDILQSAWKWHSSHPEGYEHG